MTPERWRQIEDLYHAALVRDPAERAVLLESTDPEIRLRVERMLAVDSTGQILDQPAANLFETAIIARIQAGDRFGPYEIEAPIGSGGMGAVYRAVDTRLGRTVAIKIAAARYSERFQMEARAISTLNHPHVCTLYDVGPDYLVMEFIEGSTLAEEICKGPLALPSMARYGAQIAEALAEAHSRGIAHCDLKPANIMLTRHGVKVLDFGLAKLLSETSASETRAMMGTPAYMAPEQADGREPDARSDLYSLGLVLREMAAGKVPDARQRAAVPAKLDALIARLLAIDPAERPQSAAEVAAELEAIADPPRKRRLSWKIAALLCALLALAAIAIYRFARPRALKLTYTQLTDFPDSVVSPALSRDGRMLAFIRGDVPFTTTGEIYVKTLPDGQARRLTHNGLDKYNVAFSPDGSRIAYTVFEHPFNTYTVPVRGGESRRMLINAAGLSWLDDHHLLFSWIREGMHMGIVTANENGGNIHEIYFPAHERGMAHYSWPSPDHRFALVSEMDSVGYFGQCRLISLDGHLQSRLVGPLASCRSAGWSPDGSWMYFTAIGNNGSHLWRQRFPAGQPEQLTFGPSEEDGVAVDPHDGSVITSIGVHESSIWVHRPGGERALSSEGEVLSSTPPIFSKDDKVLYYLLRRSSDRSGPELWRTIAETGDSAPMFAGVSMVAFDVSPDGKQVVYLDVGPGDKLQLWRAPSDRSVAAKRVDISGVSGPHWGPHGEILFLRAEGSFNYLEEVNADGSGRRKVVPYPVGEIMSVSPGRRWVAAIVPLAGHDVGIMAIPAGGGSPRRLCAIYCIVSWSSDGRFLFLSSTSPSQANPGQTLVLPLGPGEELPALPPGGIDSLANAIAVPGAQTIPRGELVPGRDPQHYAYINASVHRNLYRITLSGR